jgi:hypothetical protein
MENVHATSDAISVLKHLTLAEIETRLAEIDGERASLSLLRRSLLARRRAANRARRHSVSNAGEGHDA